MGTIIMELTEIKNKVAEMKEYLLSSADEFNTIINFLPEGKNDIFSDLMDVKLMLKKTHSALERAGWTLDKHIEYQKHKDGSEPQKCLCCVIHHSPGAIPLKERTEIENRFTDPDFHRIDREHKIPDGCEVTEALNYYYPDNNFTLRGKAESENSIRYVYRNRNDDNEYIYIDFDFGYPEDNSFYKNNKQ